MSDQTGQCDQCMSEIPIEAQRCPECGYQPDAGAMGTILAVIAFPVFVFSGFVAMISLILPFSGAELSTAVFGFVFFGLVAAASGGVLYLKFKQKDRTAADPSIMG